MRIVGAPSTLTMAIALIFLGSSVISAQDTAPDKYTLKVPDGLAFSEFRGYEDWAVLSVSQTENLLKIIVGNPTTIAAYRAGIPANGQPFPDGSKVAKIMWTPKAFADAPFPIVVPGALKAVDFMAKDIKRFPTGGWGYAQFNYDPAVDRFTPDGTGNSCGTTCHTIVKAKDYMFTPYDRR